MEGLNFRKIGSDRVGISLDETTDEKVLVRVLRAFGIEGVPPHRAMLELSRKPVAHQRLPDPSGLSHEPGGIRDDALHAPPVGPRSGAGPRDDPAGVLHDEAERGGRDDADHLAGIQQRCIPFVPADQALGYREAIEDLSAKLCEITGYDAFSMQPNSGAQGEYAGLLTIQAYHRARGEAHRNICLIPVSAHGTNPASAQMAGMQVVVVKAAPNGDMDLEDFRAKAAAAGGNLAACMITYPSTHGVFEETVRDICRITHDIGGQVYLDGANMNALVGLVKPGEIGSDVSHLNLHKTFAIPHGGGGPGMGPIGVKAHLAPYLPGHPRNRGRRRAGQCGTLWSRLDPADLLGLLPDDGRRGADAGDAGGDPERQLHRGAAEAARIRSCSWATRAGWRMSASWTRGPLPRSGVTVDDIAKRLIDNGFHAPTMSLAGGGHADGGADGKRDQGRDRPLHHRAAGDPRGNPRRSRTARSPAEDSPLRHAPHTVEDLVADWTRKYPREQGCFPPGAFRVDKYWPPVGRVDNVYGDRNLICICPPLESYMEAAE